MSLDGLYLYFIFGVQGKSKVSGEWACIQSAQGCEQSGFMLGNHSDLENLLT